MASTSEIAPANGYSVDITAAFDECLLHRSCETVDEFRIYLREFELTSGSNYSVRDSRKNNDGVICRSRFVCDRRGFRRHPSEGKRSRRQDHIQCPAEFTICLMNDKYVISRRTMVHNHELLAEESVKWHSRNRRLSSEQGELLRPLLESGSSAYQIRRFAMDKIGKYLTCQDIVNLRTRFFHRRNDPSKLVFRLL